MTPRYIAIEGPIGVGKTALARKLSRQFDSRLVLEPENNPFIEPFYRDRRGSAFSAQIWFLISRHRQQLELKQGRLFEQGVVADYLFEKDRVFAYLNLNDTELATYEKLYELLAADSVKPDLVVYLQARASVLADRIRTRGRDIEKRISDSYLKEVVQAFDQFFFGFDQAPLLVVDTNHIDPAHDESDFRDLARRIGAMERGGIEYYHPDRS